MKITLDGFYKSFIKDNAWMNYLDGLKMTLLISLVATLMGIAIGLIIALIKHKYAEEKNERSVGFGLALLNTLANFYTTVIRGTPVLLQLLILFAVVFNGSVQAAMIGFGINSGAYVSEIFRAGLLSVDKGQSEAGRSLGLSANKTMIKIVVPQAFKNIVPSLFNEFISLIKETSVAGSIAVIELTKVAERSKSKTFLIEPLFIAAFMYLIVVVGLTQVQKVLERRLARSDRN
ncbi:MAG: amino acid ABC transporter permease [Erysipelothrix sp.]|nr:amino acid ABC transporter permease [Erysipelothrix sp.]